MGEASARELAAKQRTIEELRGEMERMEGQILAQRGQLQGVRGELEEGQREERHFEGENERLARLVEMRRRGKGGELASGTFRPSVSSNSIRSATPKGLLAILVVKSYRQNGPLLSTIYLLLSDFTWCTIVL